MHQSETSAATVAHTGGDAGPLGIRHRPVPFFEWLGRGAAACDRDNTFRHWRAEHAARDDAAGKLFCKSQAFYALYNSVAVLGVLCAAVGNPRAQFAVALDTTRFQRNALGASVGRGRPRGRQCRHLCSTAGGDYAYACNTVVLSTLLSLGTIPIVALLGNLML